jgi:hypothetical protein
MMAPWDESDLSALARLPRVMPDASRDARVRARCHRTLMRRQRARLPGEPHARAHLNRRIILEMTLTGVVSLAYLLTVVREALAIFAR